MQNIYSSAFEHILKLPEIKEYRLKSKSMWFGKKTLLGLTFYRFPANGEFYPLPRDATVEILSICKIIVQNIDIHCDISIAYSSKHYKLQLPYFNPAANWHNKWITHVQQYFVYIPIIWWYFMLEFSNESQITFSLWSLHYNTLQYTTLHYITLHYTTTHYNTLQHTTLHCITLHYTTLHYIILQYTV